MAQQLSEPTASGFDAPPGGPPRSTVVKVPVDRRVAGLDKNTIWPGVVILVVWAVWAHLMPWIDEQIELDDPIVAGDVIDLGDDGPSSGQLTFVPAPGWNFESGLRYVPGGSPIVGVPTSVALTKDRVFFTASSGNWEGTAEEHVDRMLDVNESLDRLIVADEQGRTEVTTAAGQPGQLVYVLSDEEGVLIAAFVYDSIQDPEGPTKIGVEFEVQGTADDLREAAADVASMIDSLTYLPVEEADS